MINKNWTKQDTDNGVINVVVMLIMVIAICLMAASLCYLWLPKADNNDLLISPDMSEYLIKYPQQNIDIYDSE
jgi:hypothetical protein